MTHLDSKNSSSHSLEHSTFYILSLFLFSLYFYSSPDFNTLSHSLNTHVSDFLFLPCAAIQHRKKRRSTSSSNRWYKQHFLSALHFAFIHFWCISSICLGLLTLFPFFLLSCNIFLDEWQLKKYSVVYGSWMSSLCW